MVGWEILFVMMNLLMRAFVWILVHIIYRVRVRGVVENLPSKGACVVVCNHVSFVDALILLSAVKRPIRFVMDHHIFKMPLLGLIFRIGKAIPIASKREDEALMEKAFRDVEVALAQGDVVGIFPEGKITRTGDINQFRPGIERLIATSPVPVVPLALRGLWGSFFSRVDGHAMRHPFRRGVWSRVELVAGEVVPAKEVSAKMLEERVRNLRGDMP